MPVPCVHLTGVTREPMPAGGCTECLATGGTWVHLRYCVACGLTGCCDSSPNRHASRHAAATGHNVIRSKEPGENWAYCYDDDVVVQINPL